MSAGKMHADEVDIDVSLVHRLIDAQFPMWADLPISPIESSGTDNAMYRLGEEMAVRMPRTVSATGQVSKEQTWLPQLASQLPLSIPAPLGNGAPAEGYPYPWSVYSWLEGETATVEGIDDLSAVAADLGQFVAALQQIDPSTGPGAGPHSGGRGMSLAGRDDHVHSSIASLEGIVDIGAATAAWDSALQAPEWEGPPVWFHGDLHADNLLVQGGRLSGVIDFGLLGVGDPACDVLAAWNLFTGESREVFRTATGVDDATWARGRGWALFIGLTGLSYYRHTNPLFVALARRFIDEAMADHGFSAFAGLD